MRAAFLLILIGISTWSCAPNGDKVTTIEHGNLVITFDDFLHSRIAAKDEQAKAFMKSSTASEYLTCKEFTAKDFILNAATSSPYEDAIGKGTRWTITGKFSRDKFQVEKNITITLYNQFPDQAFFKVSYVNQSDQTIQVERWTNHHYEILSQGDTVPFWSFQGQSTGDRKDWVFPMKAGFHQQNFMGMNNSDYGGGVPVTDVWRSDLGLAIGSAEIVPALISLPVDVDSTGSSISIVKDYPSAHKLAPNDTITTLQTFVNIHEGDYYVGLKRYGEVLRAKGLKFAPPEDAAFEASWCAWGYMRDFTLDEIRGTLPKVKELGIKWVTLDDGFQQAEGDWHVNSNKFSKGDVQMKSLVAEIHRQGFKVMLWWAPLAADPGSKLLATNPGMKIINESGKPQDITWWDAYYLAPTDDATQAHTREVLDLFLKQWNVDGLKMDGQHLNAVPPDYDQHHEITSPEQSHENFPSSLK